MYIFVLQARLSFQLITSGNLAVDTFFFLSGFLAVLLMIEGLAKQPEEINGKKGVMFVLMAYLNRYLRLTPLYALTMLILIFISPTLSAGPHWATWQVGVKIIYGIFT